MVCLIRVPVYEIMKEKVLRVLNIIISTFVIVLAGCHIQKKVTPPLVMTDAEENNSAGNNDAKTVEESTPKKVERHGRRLGSNGLTNEVNIKVVKKEEKVDTIALDTTNMLQEIIVEAERINYKGTYVGYGPPTPSN